MILSDVVDTCEDNSITDVIAPGRAMIGIPTGVIPISSLAPASSVSWGVDDDLGVFASIILKLVLKNKIPPAIINASIVIP